MFPLPARTSRWAMLLREPEFTLAQVLLWLFVVLTSLQVIMRYVFNAPLTWPEELTQILLVWMTFIAAVGLSRAKIHIRIEIVEEMIGDRGRHAMDAVFNLLTVVFMVLLVVGGWDMFQQLEFERTPALRWKWNIIYAVVPLSAAAMFVIHLLQFLYNIAEVVGGVRRGP